MHKPQSDAPASLFALFALAVWFLIYCLVEPANAAERIRPPDFSSSFDAAAMLTLLLPIVAVLAGFGVALACLAQRRRPIRRDAYLEACRRADHEFCAAERDHPDVAAYIRASARRAEARASGQTQHVAGAFFPIGTLAIAGALVFYVAAGFLS